MLVRIGHASEYSELRDGEVVNKVFYDQNLSLRRLASGELFCCGVDGKQIPLYQDDGTIWVNIDTQSAEPAGKKALEPQVGQGYGLGFGLGFSQSITEVGGESVMPLPLLPFAGFEKSPMPPSAEKKQQARDLPAHSAVVRKLAFGADVKQTRMSDYFAKGHTAVSLPVDMDF